MKRKTRKPKGSVFHPRWKKDGKMYEATTWHLKYYVNGQVIRERTPFKGPEQEQDAWLRLAQRQKEIKEGRFQPPEPHDVTVAKILEHYLSASNHLDSIGTQQGRVHRHLIPFFKDMKAVAVTTDDLRAYRDQRLTDGAANATVNRELMTLLRAYHQAIEGKTLRPDDKPNFQTKKHERKNLWLPERKRTGFFEPHEYEAMVAALPSPFKDMLIFGYHSGWRRNEILYLTWADVDEADGLIYVRGERSKNDEPRSIDLIGPLAEVIQRRQRDRWKGEDRTWTGYVKGVDLKASQLVFHVEGNLISGTRFHRTWKAACAVAGVSKLFHDIRRTVVRNLIRRNVPQTVAMEITGHKTLSVFQRYDIVDRRDRRKAVLALAQPISQDQAKAGTGKVVKMGRRTG